MKRIVFFTFVLAGTISPFCNADLVVGPAIPVPGWEPNPNNDQEISYISPDADFMLVSIHHWPNRYVAKRAWNPATSSWDPAENIGLTGADNTHGYLSPDMNMIVYGAGYWDTMIHRSIWSGSSWLPGEQILFIPTWCPMFTGSKLYFNIESNTPGYLDDLAVSDYDPDTDQFSAYTRITELNTQYYEDAPWVSSDGKLILFQSDRPGGYGGTDIWCAFWDEGSQKWGSITNLGPNVNTSEHERFPRIAEDAQLLFFIRDWTLLQAPISEPAIEATIDIDPNTLNLQSKGKWITCYISLPADYNVVDINSASIVLEDNIKAAWTWVDDEAQIIMVKFSRSEVESILQPGQVELKVSGEFINGRRFEGTDTINVINEGKGN